MISSICAEATNTSPIDIRGLPELDLKRLDYGSDSENIDC